MWDLFHHAASPSTFLMATKPPPDFFDRQFRRRAAAPHDQMGQAKLDELREAKMGGNRLPLLAFCHIDGQSDRILAQFMTMASIADRPRVPDKFSAKKNPQSVGYIFNLH